MMELIRGIYNLRPHHRGCALTIGNFDGIHRGHQAVIRQLVQRAHQLSLPATVMTFEPLPLEYFAPERAPARLSRLHEKLLLLDAEGVDRMLVARFGRQLAQMSAEAFIEDLLVRQLGVRFLVIGDDFRFGRQRKGDFALLKQAGKHHGFEVVNTSSLLHSDERVSSTRIRASLEEGNFELAEKLLGRRYAFSGRVSHGDKRGRQLGFPTANIHLGRLNSPVSGVFAVELMGVDGDRPWFGVANIGERPTVAGTEARIEAHLFDFNGDLYGKRLQVVLRKRLRSEMRFDSLAALETQIGKDVQAARAFFASTPLASASTGL